ncbi:MAG: YgjV family protein [Oscillospiraceae bacterium]|nr:YgjV family protein [Oscillospiraceae bacterium]
MQVILDSFIASFTENLTAQIVGMVALLINVLSYQFNERKNILTMQFFSC